MCFMTRGRWLTCISASAAGNVLYFCNREFRQYGGFFKQILTCVIVCNQICPRLTCIFFFKTYFMFVGKTRVPGENQTWETMQTVTILIENLPRTPEWNCTQNITLHLPGPHQRRKHGSWKAFLEMEGSRLVGCCCCLRHPEEQKQAIIQRPDLKNWSLNLLMSGPHQDGH